MQLEKLLHGILKKSLNMSKITLLALFILVSSISFSQDLKKIYLLNKKDSSEIAFATIKILNTDLGTFSNENGEFEIPKKTDSLLISCIGYKEQRLSLSNLKDDIIYLEPLFVELPDIIVKKRNSIGKDILGINKGNFDFLWGPSGSGEEFAQKISLSQNDQEIIKLLKVILLAKNFNNEYPVVLHIYEEDKLTHLPGKEILTNTYVIKKQNFKGNKIVIDLSSENILLDQKIIFVSFQWLSNNLSSNKTKKSGTLLYMTRNISEELTYFRRLSTKEYYWIPAPRVPDRTKPSNTMFSIEIERYK